MGAALGTPTVTHLPPAEILEAEKADKVERSGESLPAASETHSLNGFFIFKINRYYIRGVRHEK